jgi:hypothetical protein
LRDKIPNPTLGAIKEVLYTIKTPTFLAVMLEVLGFLVKNRLL